MSAAGHLAGSGTTGPVATVRRCLANIVTSLRVLFLPVRGAPKRRIRKAWLPLLMVIALFAIAVPLGMVLVDAPVANAIKSAAPDVVSFFRFVTDFGKGAWFAWPFGLAFIALAALPRRRLTAMGQGVVDTLMVRVGFIFVATGLPGLFSSLIKNMIGRMRPPLANVSANPFIFDPFHWAPAYASFPSGHATTGFAAFAALSMLWPRWSPLFVVYALVIAASRVFVTAHYVTDVCGGALVGIVGAMLVQRWFALRRLGFSVGPDGLIAPFPGPSLKRIKQVARGLFS